MTGSRIDTSAERALALDRADPLAGFRARFALPAGDGEPAAYLCGHSLGPMPLAARDCVERELDRWAREGVAGHFGDDGGWYAYHERFAAPLAALAGTTADSVVAMNALTVNLHLMLVSFFRPDGRRRKILIERGAFPSDRYAVQSHLALQGLDPARDLIEIDLGADAAGRLDAALGEHAGDVALVLLPGVQFLTGQVLPTAELGAVAARHDVRFGLDLAHAIGSVPLTLDADGVDFAVWCSYKYLNAGPGAIGGCYVNRRWHDAKLPRLEGWWGHAKERRFALEQTFAGIGTAEAWQLSNPPILAMAPLAASLGLFAEAGFDRLRAKSAALGAYAIELLDACCGDRATLLTPRAADSRGCQLSVRLDLGDVSPAAFVAGLAERNVVVDWRAPDILRFAAAPLYNSFADVRRAVTAIASVLMK